MASCQKCGDTGVLHKPGDQLVECACALLRRIAASMPPHIRRATALRAHFDHPVVRKPFRSLFVKASWPDTKAMVKAVVMMNPNSFIRITSDREILDVFLGKKSKGARDVETRRPRTAADLEDSDTNYSSIEDLMDHPRLCVVRLNEIGYKNKSAHACLEEALSYRIDRDKPVWIVSNIDKPFVQGSPAWSESVWDYITSTVPAVTIPRIAPRMVMELTDDDLAAEPFSPAPEPPTAAPGAPMSGHTSSNATVAGSGPRAAPARAPAADPPPFDLDPEPVEREDKRIVPRRSRVRPSDDDDARPSGLGIYGVGLTQSSKGRIRKG